MARVKLPDVAAEFPHPRWKRGGVVVDSAEKVAELVAAGGVVLPDEAVEAVAVEPSSPAPAGKGKGSRKK